MGYSARYHAASLAAIFLALAIGILIGVGFGDDVVSNTSRNLEESLTGDLEAARQRADDLAAELARSEEFGERVYPVLAGGRLTGRRVGVLALGGLPDDLSGEIETSLQPSGARLTSVAVVREPPDLGGLASDLKGSRFADVDVNPDTAEALGKAVGRQIVLGGNLVDRVRSDLLSRASGRFGDIDSLIVVRQQPELDAEDRVAANNLEAGLLDGAVAAGATGVGVEDTDTEPSSIGFFSAHDLSTVDDLDRVSGQVALIFALLGAEGNFGTKDTADRLLPDLLTPSPRSPSGTGAGG
ncbi:MAG: copper transporter [Actinomycetota bacterium]